MQITPPQPAAQQHLGPASSAAPAAASLPVDPETQEGLAPTGTNPVRMNSINFLDIVKDLASVGEDFCATPQPKDPENNLGFGTLPASNPEYSSGVSSSMEIDAQYGTAESAWNGVAHGSCALPGGVQTSLDQPGLCLQWQSTENATSMLDDLFRNSVQQLASRQDLMKIQTRSPGAASELANSKPSTATSHSSVAIADLSCALQALQRQSSLTQNFASGEAELPFEAPLLGEYGSRDSVRSAPGLGHQDDSYDSRSESRDGSTEAKPAMGRSQSLAVPDTAYNNISLALSGRSQSVTVSGLYGNKQENRPKNRINKRSPTSRAYSEAGPGTNRPPKEGSQSALLPKDKLSRKRAAARRYYHNQKNKVIDYEEAISRLETENATLAQELALALEKLEMLRQSQGLL